MLLGLLLVVPGIVLTTSHPASADARGPISVKEGPSQKIQFDAIHGEGQVNEQVNDPTPKECSEAPGRAYCDAVSVIVQLPADYDEATDEFVTKVVLNWQDAAGGDDMDLFIYDPHQVETGKSAGMTQPEHSASADTKFTVVVDNSSGLNQGYSLTLTFVRKRFTPVTEKPGFFNSTASTVTPPTQPSTPSTVPPFLLTPGSLDLPPLDLTDPDFVAGSGNDALAAGLFKNPIAVTKQKPAKPVAAGVLIAALAGIPALAVGAGGVFFRRRASRLLQF